MTELISENAPNLRTVILVRISELGSARTELPEQVRTYQWSFNTMVRTENAVESMQ